MLRATPESPKMFDNPALDALSRVPAWVVPLLYIPIVLALIAHSASLGTAPTSLVIQFIAGFTVWTLTEYWLHRTLFHWIPNTSWGERLHFLMHGVHHKWVHDRLRLVMPPAASLFAGGLLLGLYTALAAALSGLIAPTWVSGFFAGKVAGYLYYDMMHYYLHHARPTNRYLKRLRAHHMNHHFNHQDRRFGVSMMLWDRVFGTFH